MSPDVWRMLLGAILCCVAGSVALGILIGSEITRRRQRRDKARQIQRVQHLTPAAPTAVYSPAQWRELWRPADDETVLLRRVDPTAFPKARRRVHSGGRRLR